jgi:hypothetical protein
MTIGLAIFINPVMTGRMRTGSLMTVFVALLVSLGCHHDKYGIKTSHPEELTVPPDEPRYNNPPQSEYKKPPPKKEFRPGMGAPGGPGGGMGGVGR